MDENGNNQERLTRDMSATEDPSWSPDGQRIAYESLDRGGNIQIFVVRTDGSGLQKTLTRNRPNKRSPAWSPDGDTIAYTSWDALFDRTTIHLMTAEGEHLKQLSEEHDGSDTDPDWFAPVGWSVSPAANFVTIWGKIKKPTSALRCCARRA